PGATGVTTACGSTRGASWRPAAPTTWSTSTPSSPRERGLRPASFDRVPTGRYTPPVFRPAPRQRTRKRSRRVALALAAWLGAVVALPLAALASTWTISLDLSIGGSPAHVDFQAQLADPTGSTTVNLGGVPVTVRR